MIKASSKIGKAVKDDIAKQLEVFRQQYPAQVDLGDVGALVENLLLSLRGDISVGDVYVHNELKSLVEYIEQTRSDIASIQPHEISDSHIPSATDELDAVVGATEVAANAILECAEELETLGGELGGDAEARISDIVTKIYEASTFQDLTGQRITKVVNLLRHIEEKLAVLARAAGHQVSGGGQAAVDDREGEAALLNGPQLPGNANNQDDIDALFASFD